MLSTFLYKLCLFLYDSAARFSICPSLEYPVKYSMIGEVAVPLIISKTRPFYSGPHCELAIELARIRRSL